MRKLIGFTCFPPLKAKIGDRAVYEEAYRFYLFPPLKAKIRARAVYEEANRFYLFPPLKAKIGAMAVYEEAYRFYLFPPLKAKIGVRAVYEEAYRVYLFPPLKIKIGVRAVCMDHEVFHALFPCLTYVLQKLFTVTTNQPCFIIFFFFNYKYADVTRNNITATCPTGKQMTERSRSKWIMFFCGEKIFTIHPQLKTIPATKKSVTTN